MRLYYKLKNVKSGSYVILKYKYKSKELDLSPSIRVEKKDFGDGRSDTPIKRTDTEFLKKNEVLRGFKEQVGKSTQIDPLNICNRISCFSSKKG